MSVFPEVLDRRIQSLENDSRRRVLSPRRGIDFSSNDYLGFSQDPKLKERALHHLPRLTTGATASRLLRGEMEIFQEAESILADFCGRASATLFPSGYQANVGLLSSLLSSEDIVFSDEYNHASIIDGIRLSGATRRIFKHSDLKSLRQALIDTRSDSFGLKLIVVESLYGMDGDLSPLEAIIELAEEFGCVVVVDEAHATGLWGDFSSHRGGGIIQSLGLSHRVLATIHPAGKAMGVGGAWICGDEKLKDFLINFSRPFIFSTAPLPILAAFLMASVSYWKEVGVDRAKEVLEKANTFRKKLEVLSFFSNAVGPITPIILGSNQRVWKLSQKLQNLGFDVRAIRPPTVPVGTARLRVTLHWDQSLNEIEQLLKALSEDLLK